MIFKSTNFIAEAFDKKGIKYHIEEQDDYSCVAAPFGIEGGPVATVRFISRDNDEDVAVRVFSVVNETPKEKELEMLRACSKINCAVRYAKLYMDDDGDVNMEWDFPLKTPEDAVGEIAIESFFRFVRILKAEYHTLAQVIYADGGFKPKDTLAELHELFEKLKALRENPIVVDEGTGEDLDADVSIDPDPSMYLDSLDPTSDFCADDEDA